MNANNLVRVGILGRPEAHEYLMLAARSSVRFMLQEVEEAPLHGERRTIVESSLGGFPPAFPTARSSVQIRISADNLTSVLGWESLSLRTTHSGQIRVRRTLSLFDNPTCSVAVSTLAI